MQRTQKLLLRGSLYLILGYRFLVSPFFCECCRFYPSCSQYAMDAFRVHGILKGSWLAFRRILRCNPWHSPGFDPVETAVEETVEKKYHL